MLAAVDGAPAGVLAVADTVKDDSATAIAALHRLGVEVVMLTGDDARTAAAIARSVGVRRAVAEVLPQHKVAASMLIICPLPASRFVRTGGITMLKMMGGHPAPQVTFTITTPAPGTHPRQCGSKRP